MNTTQTSRLAYVAGSADLTDLLNLTDYPWSPTRWGGATITISDDHAIRITEDDGTFFVMVLSGGRAELIHTHVQFSGIAAQAAVLATLDALVAELI